MADALDGDAGDRVEWMTEYRNQDIVPDVFDRCDAIVVPSIWAENSPLVIHEAAPGGGAGDHRRLRRHGRVRRPRAERSPVHPPRPGVLGAADAAPGRCAGSGRGGWDAGDTCSRTTATCRTLRNTRSPSSRSTPTSFPNEETHDHGTHIGRDRRGCRQRRLSGPLAHHVRHQPRRLQPALHHVRGPLALQQHPARPSCRWTAETPHGHRPDPTHPG